ncbi:uncharacterized protein BYT42DRAFT_515772 [Radiomyces spectabilis]|uniref:uncharacterized protein n=1 Tax=Radiomyces spectabilis TaxID=64574 RepID=UPI00221E7D73|nr:uncharacterized protein BYT42DRAFT_515772 [Radiomyces spectabilis]KAI8377641.1 hypothetical protein BYT42DRAFT_515772 [Radiomyces spectabilis]
MNGFDDLDDSFFTSELLAAVEEAEKQQDGPQSRSTHVPLSPTNSDDFGDFGDDLDVEALSRVAESAEQSHRSVPSSQSLPQSQLTSFFQPSIPRSAPLATTSIPNTTPQSAVTRTTFNQAARHTERSQPPPPPPSRDVESFHPLNHEALPTWIYPINYEVRLYQLNIVQKALFSNTLVALPTGLGKTFIAAVVMYNYWRWFPCSKIIFMAPTRPLVAQQIEACFKICGLPQEDTIEMTGQMPPAARKTLWASKRVFFLTPQVLQNDLQSHHCPADKVACIVIDEAHKATGNHAYVEVIKLIARRQSHFRVLALTATPGTNIFNVQTVITNLRITNVQIRTEASMDIQEFSHGRTVENIVVKLDYTAGASGVVPQAVQEFRTEIFQPVLEGLKKLQAIDDTNADRNSPYSLLSAQKRFNERARNFNAQLKGKIYSEFSVAQHLSRAYDMLCQHGVTPFLQTTDSFLDGLRADAAKKSLSQVKQRILNSSHLKRLLTTLRQQQQQRGFIGHPKLECLVNIILQHLSNGQDTDMNDTRVIVFSSFRNSVDEIVKVLSEHEPLIRCSSFVGQASSKSGAKGHNQKMQQQLIDRFKRGELNVIVATSIGEEGLDIGEVDLIVCYDTQNSPIRMLQRMGRTGRKRKGRCVMLMTEHEEKKLYKARESYKIVQQAVAKGDRLQYFSPNPTVIPENYKPVICKKELVIGQYIQPSTGKRGRKRKEDAARVKSDGTLTDGALQDFLSRLSTYGERINSIDEASDRFWPVKSSAANARKYISLQTQLGSSKRVGHSKRTQDFVTLIKQMEQHMFHHPINEDKRLYHTAFGATDEPINQAPALIIPKRRKTRPSKENEESNEMERDNVMPKPRLPASTPGPSEPAIPAIPLEDEWIPNIALITQGIPGEDTADFFHEEMSFFDYHDDPPPNDYDMPRNEHKGKGKANATTMPVEKEMSPEFMLDEAFFDAALLDEVSLIEATQGKQESPARVVQDETSVTKPETVYNPMDSVPDETSIAKPEIVDDPMDSGLDEIMLLNDQLDDIEMVIAEEATPASPSAATVDAVAKVEEQSWRPKEWTRKSAFIDIAKYKDVLLVVGESQGNIQEEDPASSSSAASLDGDGPFTFDDPLPPVHPYYDSQRLKAINASLYFWMKQQSR